MLTRESSDLVSDFLLSFTLPGSAFVTAPCAKSDVSEESKAASVCVIFPGFMGQLGSTTLPIFRRAAGQKNSSEIRKDLSSNQHRVRKISVLREVSQQIFRDLEFRPDRELFSGYDEVRAPSRWSLPATIVSWPDRCRAR